MNCNARTSCGQPKKRFGAKGSEAFPVHAPPYDARHGRNVCTAAIHPISFVLIRTVSQHSAGLGEVVPLDPEYSRTPVPKTGQTGTNGKKILTAKKRPRRVSFRYFSSFAANASSASIMASSKEGWGRMVRSICSAVRWLTMASLIWLIMSLACWHMN